MGDLEDPDSEGLQGKFRKYLGRVDGRLCSESIEKQFAPSDVYYSTASIVNHNRSPGSRAKGKDNARAGKGARWGGKGEANRAECIENPAGSDNYHTQGELENEGGDNYQDNWGNQTSDVRYTGEIIDSSSELDWGELKTTGPIARRGDIS